MIKYIYKYILNPGDSEISLPIGARILSTNVQNDKICIWALIDPVADICRRKFTILGTGHTTIDVETLTFIGTVLMSGGQLVFHIWIEEERKRV